MVDNAGMEEVDRRVARFHALLDREAAGTLSVAETEELTALENDFDAEELPDLLMLQRQAAERQAMFDEALQLIEDARKPKSMSASGD